MWTGVSQKSPVEAPQVIRNVSVPGRLYPVLDELLKPRQFGLALFGGQGFGFVPGKGLFRLPGFVFTLLSCGADGEPLQNHSLDPGESFAYMYERGHDEHDHRYHKQK